MRAGNGKSPLVTLSGRRGVAPVPVEIRDAVEKWARDRHGSHADIVYVQWTDPPIPQVRIELRAHDPRLKAYQEGRVDEKPVETVELVEWDDEAGKYRGMNLTDLGADGVVALLDEGNMASGRGEFDSLQEAVVAAREQHKQKAEKLRKWTRGEAIARAEDRAYGDRSTAKMFTVDDNISSERDEQ